MKFVEMQEIHETTSYKILLKKHKGNWLKKQENKNKSSSPLHPSKAPDPLASEAMPLLRGHCPLALVPWPLPVTLYILIIGLCPCSLALIPS